MLSPCPLILCGWCTIKADVKVTAPVTVNFGGWVWLAKTSINHRQIWECSKHTPEETSSTLLTPDGSGTGTGNSTKPRTILLKCHQECQEKRHTPPGTDSGASSSLPQRPGFVNNSPVDPRDNGILAGCHWQCCSRQPQSLTTTFRTEWKYRD